MIEPRAKLELAHETAWASMRGLLHARQSEKVAQKKPQEQRARLYGSMATIRAAPGGKAWPVERLALSGWLNDTIDRLLDNVTLASGIELIRGKQEVRPGKAPGPIQWPASRHERPDVGVGLWHASRGHKSALAPKMVKQKLKDRHKPMTRDVELHWRLFERLLRA